MKDEIKYFLYVRKSTDVEDKQVQSLDDQINVMKKKAKELGIEIVDVFSESMSAKAPGRYKFSEMIGRIQAGEAKGIISWKLDRLTRNPIDTGAMQYMLQNGALQKIITNDREYNPVDAGLLFSVETGMSNQFLLDLKKNVKRGMDGKTARGVFCGQAPEGYLNNKVEKTIEVDKENFLLIRKAWELMMTGSYTVPQVLKLLNDKWGYKRKKRNGGKQISLTGLYSIFKNPFYTGDFLRKGEIRKGTHKQMITWAEYERVQEVIGKKGSAIRGKTKEFAFAGTMKCGECGCSIVAESKDKYIKESGKIKTYTYYHCSKRKKGCTCKQKSIASSKLEKQIKEILESLEVLPEFQEWGLDILKEDFHTVKNEQDKIIDGLEKNIKTLKKKSDTLLDYLLDGTIDKKDYEERKTVNTKLIKKYEIQLKKFTDEKDTSIAKTEGLFDFIVSITEKFNSGSLQDKKVIFSFLGENFTLKDGVLALNLHSWLKPIIKQLPNIKREYRRLEPNKKPLSKGKTEAENQIISLWSRLGHNYISHSKTICKAKEIAKQLIEFQRIPLRLFLFGFIDDLFGKLSKIML